MNSGIENGLALLRDASRKNEQLTTHLVGILDSFEDRIGRLQDTILPVYQHTESLRLKQKNVERTLKLLDQVIGYYSVSQDVEAVIRGGISSGNLDDFLQATAAIEKAVKYFETNNSQSVELENLLSLYTAAGDALNKEFRDTLQRHSKPISAVALLDMIDEENPSTNQQNSSMSMPEHVQGNLKKLAEWLMYNNFDSYMNVYASIRSNVLLKSVQDLKDYQKSSSLTMASPSISMATPSPSSPVMKGRFRHITDSAKKGRLSYALEKRASKIIQKASAAVESSMGYGSKKTECKDDAVSDRESENFLILTTAMLKLMQIESQIMLGVIPMVHRQKIFEIITRDSFEVLFTDGESISSRIKRSIGRHEYTAILTIFPIIKCLQTLQPSFDEIFVGTLQNAKNNKLAVLLKTFQTNGVRALESFIENVRNEQTSQLPKDGTVHELTSNVLMFLEHLTEYTDVVANVLAQDQYYNPVALSSSKAVDENAKRSLIGAYIKRVLQQLNLTLVTCSDMYYDHSIKAIFRLNNACYILKCIQNSVLLDLLKSKDPDCQQNYVDIMEDQKKAYLIATWKKTEDKLVTPDDIPVAVVQAGKLRDKDRQTIKDKFSAFNREFEEISRQQQTYAVPDPELRSTLRKASQAFIIAHYRGFYERYANVQFAKNSTKYIKYSPQQVEAKIDSFFDAS